ncbi:hypothetical protein [Methylobacterium sp. 174MFSha1.1]|uniref:hypothetical protein n=1 Tax=Methylobacterium sp. 174MFSha1.1 TaxID=1502749 RepID=UPI0015A57455|nr:hypothetical protein [Methylobacterium sp. 174MFSha1.1]
MLAPDGSWGSANSGTDPLPALLAGCRAKDPACRPYAVDGDVVWTANAGGPPQ